jgi:hypothetical protein
MPGVFKVGMTVRTPTERLKEANSSDTWRPPTGYELADFVYVDNALDMERLVHLQLEEYGYRIHPRREFFKAPLTEIKAILESVNYDRHEKKVTSETPTRMRLRSGRVI